MHCFLFLSPFSHLVSLFYSLFSISNALSAGAADDSAPMFAEPITNSTVFLGRDAALECALKNLGDKRVSWWSMYLPLDAHATIEMWDTSITLYARWFCYSTARDMLVCGTRNIWRGNTLSACYSMCSLRFNCARIMRASHEKVYVCSKTNAKVSLSAENDERKV